MYKIQKIVRNSILLVCFSFVGCYTSANDSVLPTSERTIQQSVLSIRPTPDVSDLIDKFIAEQATVLGASENAESRKMVFGDLNDDKKDDFAVLYTLEGFDGTNLYVQYLAIFVKGPDNNWVYLSNKKIGGKNQRAIQLLGIEEEQIRVRIWEYLTSDGSCCPSKESLIRIQIKGNELIEVP